MSNPNYTLEIVSQNPDSKNRNFKKYQIEGIESIGVEKNEPFEIRFKNNTWQKVQVKLSLDGTDILTGEPATTEATKDMWVVNGYDTLTIKAWPETHNGGAQFVFTSANNSVAVHTHGDLSSRGIIAAAVFVEGHVEPLKYNPPTVINHHHHHYPKYYDYWWTNFPIYGGGGTYTSNVVPTIKGISYNNSNSIRSQSIYMNDTSSSDVSMSCDNTSTKISDSNLDELVAVGAGQYVNQKITYVQGLIKPQFTETVRVRYLAWNELVTKLKEHNVAHSHASGFPGDKKQNIMSLGSTPRIGESLQKTIASEPQYSRF